MCLIVHFILPGGAVHFALRQILGLTDSSERSATNISMCYLMIFVFSEIFCIVQEFQQIFDIFITI